MNITTTYRCYKYDSWWYNTAQGNGNIADVDRLKYRSRDADLVAWRELSRALSFSIVAPHVLPEVAKGTCPT